MSRSREILWKILVDEREDLTDRQEAISERVNSAWQFAKLVGREFSESLDSEGSFEECKTSLTQDIEALVLGDLKGELKLFGRVIIYSYTISNSSPRTSFQLRQALSRCPLF